MDNHIKNISIRPLVSVGETLKVRMFVFPGLVYLLRQMISPNGLLSFRATTSSPSVTSPCSRLSLGAEKSWQRRCFHSHHNKDKLGIGIRCNRK